MDQRAAASARDLSALLCHDDLDVTSGAIVDGLHTAICLNELADCLVGAKNELAEFLHVHNAIARKPGRAPSDAATLIAERLDQSFQALKRDAPVLLSALQRELPSTSFLDLTLLTQQSLSTLNTTLASFEQELARWAVNAFAAVASDPRLRPPDQHEGASNAPTVSTSPYSSPGLQARARNRLANGTCAFGYPERAVATTLNSLVRMSNLQSASSTGQTGAGGKTSRRIHPSDSNRAS